MKCEICGTEHQAHHAHVFSSVLVPAQRNQVVTKKEVTCNHCVTKDGEIARLRNQLEELRADIARHVQIASGVVSKPKRDRAEYMREYRAGKWKSA